MTERLNLLTGTQWEKLAGTSRAVRIGNTIEIAGITSGIENGKALGGNNAEKQTLIILNNIQKILSNAGANLSDVIRTRIYITDKNNYESVARTHKTFFGEVTPASTIVEVKSLLSEQFLVEIEATAIL